MKYVESMSFDANIVLKRQNRGIQIGYQFLDGKIKLKENKLFPVSDLTLNGTVALNIGGGIFGFGSRTNVFDGTSGNGLAVIQNFSRDRSQGTKTRQLDACLLTGGIGNDPNAGTMHQCLSLIKP